MKNVYRAVPREDGGWKIVVQTPADEPESPTGFPPSPDRMELNSPAQIGPTVSPSDPPPPLD